MGKAQIVWERMGCRNTDIKDDFGEDSEGSGESSRGHFCCLKEYRCCDEQNANKNMNVKSTSGHVAKEKEEQGTGNWRKGDSRYNGAENFNFTDFNSIGCKADL